MLLAGLIQHLLGAKMTEAKVCAQRGSEARYSKDRESLGRNIAVMVLPLLEFQEQKALEEQEN